MPDSLTDKHNERALLTKLEENIERPWLFEVRSIDGKQLPSPVYEWRHRAGLGAFALHPARPEETAAISSLLKEGAITPTFTDTFDNKIIRRIELINDAPGAPNP